MKKTKLKLLTGLILFAAFLFVQDVHAQSFTSGGIEVLSEKNVDPNGFQIRDNAVAVLKAEVASLQSAAQNLNGGIAEANNSLRISYYSSVLNELSNGSEVYDALLDSYQGLAQNAIAMDVNTDVDGIVAEAIDLLD